MLVLDLINNWKAKSSPLGSDLSHTYRFPYTTKTSLLMRRFLLVLGLITIPWKGFQGLGRLFNCTDPL